MNILFIITGLGVGGAEKQVVDLADELTKLGHSVKLAYFLSEKTTVPISPNFDVLDLGNNKNNVFAFIFGFFSLIKLIKKMEPDIIHAHMFHSIILSRLSRLFVKQSKLVCTSHSSYDGGKVRMFAYKATAFLGDVFTNVSQKAVNNFETRGAAKKGTMLTVLNGIDINKFYYSYERRSAAREPLETNKKLILSVGRFHKAKDYPNLLHAFSLICDERSDVELWIVGDGDLKKDIEQLIVQLNLTGYVKLLGIRNDIPNLMCASDVYALSSAWEGFGLVVAEAMSTERVVVATDCGGVKEVIGECGFLVPTENPELFAMSLKKALSLEAEERQKLGSMARLRVKEKYSLRTVAKTWLAVYSDINAKIEERFLVCKLHRSLIAKLSE